MTRNRIWKHLRTLISFIAGVYALALLLYLATRLLPVARPWWLAFIDNFMTWYFLPVLVLLPLALLVRAKRGALLLLPLLVIGLLRYAPYFVPRAQAQLDTPTLRVVTFNTWGGNASFAEGPAFEQMDEWLHTTDADVIVLQEVPLSQRQRADGILGLADAYPQQFSTDVEGWTGALLTRLSVIESASYEPDPSFRRPRYQRVVVRVGEQSVAVYNVHIRFPIFPPRVNLPFYIPYLPMLLGYDEYERNEEMRYLLRLVERERLPFVLAGDFNMSDQSLMYNAVAAQLNDSFRAAGVGLGTSWPVSTARQDLLSFIPPLLRIDYIWHSDDLRALDARLGPALSSDHLPLVAELTIIR